MAKNIQRPQLKFKDRIDNSSTPFIPIIKRKPNALRPLEINDPSTRSHPENLQVPSVIADFVHQERIKGLDGPAMNSTAHPYRHELEVFEPSLNQFKAWKEQLYEEFDKTSFTFVETTDQLHELSQHLSTVTEFAVDLEVYNNTLNV
ncbi:Exosome component 10 [Desmophyllum pertusum]|uniref:Exosome component 10 n=1 Tax=Desmophyllum pertusum TaxID=174260 RepID=A0A9X0CHL7_9CNID|nr:Exosome component 10 [Desmophyllum pertusum]